MASMTLNELISELYAVKDRIRDYGGKSIYGKQRGKILLVKRKEELLVMIKKELGNMEKEKSDEIRSKLYNELGVVIGA